MRKKLKKNDGQQFHQYYQQNETRLSSQVIPHKIYHNIDIWCWESWLCFGICTNMRRSQTVKWDPITTLPLRAKAEHIYTND